MLSVHIKRIILIETQDNFVFFGGARIYVNRIGVRAMIILNGGSCTVILTVIFIQISVFNFVFSKPTDSNLKSNENLVTNVNLKTTLHDLRIEAFKERIMSQLGYQASPNVSNVHNHIKEKRKTIREYRNLLKSRGEMEYLPDVDDEKSSTLLTHSYSGEHKL